MNNNSNNNNKDEKLVYLHRKNIEIETERTIKWVLNHFVNSSKCVLKNRHFFCVLRQKRKKHDMFVKMMPGV